MGAKGGRAPKDAPISDGFNPLKRGGMSLRELKKAERAALVKKRALQTEKAKIEMAVTKLTEKQAAVESELGEKPVVEEAPPQNQDAADEKSAYQMLTDLRYAYRHSKGANGAVGKRRLVELMESDPEFKFMVKELMKIESALLAAKIRSDKGPDMQANQMVFVVLKGLEEEKKFEQVGDVDIKQIARAMNPDGSEYDSAR